MKLIEIAERSADLTDAARAIYAEARRIEAEAREHGATEAKRLLLRAIMLKDECIGLLQAADAQGFEDN